MTERRLRSDHPSVRIRRAADRFQSSTDGIRSDHVFSAGSYYDPDWISFGPLVAVDEHTVDVGAGFDEHRHREVEIVTYVLSGALRHRDAAGHAETLGAGDVAVQRAGSGVDHEERNAGGAAPVRFLQMSFLASALAAPGYAVHRRPSGASVFQSVLEVEAYPTDPRVPGTVRATLYRAGDARPGQLRLPAGGARYLFLASGRVELDGAELAASDSALITGTTLTDVDVLEPADLLVWTLRSAP